MTPAEVTEIVRREWQETLGLHDMGIVDGLDFFSYGGDSIAAVSLLNRLQDKLGVEIPVEPLFLEGTEAALLKACLETMSSHGER
jgi:acyl carrier protein